MRYSLFAAVALLVAGASASRVDVERENELLKKLNTATSHLVKAEQAAASAQEERVEALEALLEMKGNVAKRQEETLNHLADKATEGEAEAPEAIRMEEDEHAASSASSTSTTLVGESTSTSDDEQSPFTAQLTDK